MKVMIIIPTLKMGGAERMVETLCVSLKKLGVSVVVAIFHQHGTPIENRLKSEDIRIISLDKNNGFSISAVTNLQNIIKNEEPDIIHTHLHTLPYAWIASRGIPIVHTIHTIAQKEQSGIGKIICRFLYKHSPRCFPVAISSLVKDSLVECFGVKPEKIYIINNGVDFSKIPLKTDYSIKDHINIIHIARFYKMKNHDLIVSTFERLIKNNRNIQLYFVGDGEERKRIEKAVYESEISDNIHFEGTQATVVPYLRLADIFILPSQFEGMPISIIEAMGAALPIVASNVGGVPDLIDNGKNGILIHPSVDELESAVTSLISSETLRMKYGTQAHNKAINFSADIMAENYYNIYRKAYR